MGNDFSKKEKDVMRFVVFLSYVGTARTESKTSKLFTYSFISAEEILSNLDQ